MYIRLLKLVGLNVVQSVVISGTIMIGHSIYRKIKFDRVTKKYEDSLKEYENRQWQPESKEK